MKTTNINIPKLRFSEFEGDTNNPYKKYSFKDIFLFSTGKNIKQKEASPKFEIPCVRYGELYYMYKEVITEIINKTNLDKSELLFSDGDEILLPSAGEDPLDIGSASALTIQNVAIGRTINILKPLKTNVYSQNYVSYYINQKLRKKISTLAKGVSISNVYNSDLKTLEIILPTLPEQQKIATFLTAVDEKLQALKQKKTLLEQYKKGVMQRIFNQSLNLDSQNSLNHDLSDLPDDHDFEKQENQKSGQSSESQKSRFRQLRFKDENGNEFPKWEMKKLQKVFYSEKGKGLSKDKIIKNGIYECILYGELYTKYKEVVFEVESKTNIEQGIKSRIGDLLIPSSTTTTGIDLANVTALNKNDVLLGGDITVLRSNLKLDNVFYAYYLSNHKKHEIASYAQGSTIVHLYYSHIKEMVIIIPSLPEQTRIANFLSALDDKIIRTETQIQQTQEYKKGLLQKMFV